MEKLSFEEFIEITWDYVSEYVVSDDYWEDNNEFIRNITFDLYRLYEKTNMFDNGYCINPKITPRICGKILESFFSNLIKYEK